MVINTNKLGHFEVEPMFRLAFNTAFIEDK